MPAVVHSQLRPPALLIRRSVRLYRRCWKSEAERLGWNLSSCSCSLGKQEVKRAGEAFTQTHKKTLNNRTVNFLWTQNDTSEANLCLWLIY